MYSVDAQGFPITIMGVKAVCRMPGCKGRIFSSGVCASCHRKIRWAKETKGLSSHRKGSKSALTESEVRQIKLLRSRFKTHLEIGRELGINSTLVSRALSPDYRPIPDRT